MTWHSASRPNLADLQYTLPCCSGKYFCPFLWSVGLLQPFVHKQITSLLSQLGNWLTPTVVHLFHRFYFSNCGRNEKEAFLLFCSQKCTELMDLKEEMFGTYFKQCRVFKLYYRILPSFFFSFERKWRLCWQPFWCHFNDRTWGEHYESGLSPTDSLSHGARYLPDCLLIWNNKHRKHCLITGFSVYVVILEQLSEELLSGVCGWLKTKIQKQSIKFLIKLK